MMNNMIIVGLTDVSYENIEAFKKYISNSEWIVFNEEKLPCRQATLGPGYGSVLERPTTNNPSPPPGSIGFRCQRVFSNGTYANGFVTAGHIAAGYSNVYSSLNAIINHQPYAVINGSYSVTGNADAAFYEVQSGNSITTTTPLGKVISNTWYLSYTTNMSVIKHGASTEETTGKVTQTSVNVTFEGNNSESTDMLKCNFRTEDGDSGGIVFAYYNNEVYVIAGIVTGGSHILWSYTSYASKADNIISMLNVIPY